MYLCYIYKTDVFPTNYLYADDVHKGIGEQHDPSQLRKRNNPCGMLLDMYVCSYVAIPILYARS